MDGFAAYLHNPYGYPSPEEKAAILCWLRKEQSLPEYKIENELDELIIKYFGNLHFLHRDGLTVYFNKLKDEVIQKHMIGLIIYGADRSRDDKKYVTYTDMNNKKTDLTRQSICYTLLKQYIKNIEELCRKTPNFDVYYNSSGNKNK